MSWVFDHSESTLGTRLVLLSVANHADKHGRNAWAAVGTYAEEAHLSVRQTQYALRSLVEIGEVRKTGMHGTRADRRTAVYELASMVDDAQNPHPVPSSDGVQAGPPRGAESGADGVQPVAPKPSLEPSVEPSNTLAPSRRERDPIFDALAEIEGLNLAEIDADTGRRIGVARAKLLRDRAAEGDITPGEIIRRASHWASHFGTATLTAGAIVKWWPRLGAAGNNGRGSGPARTLARAAALREQGR